MRMLTYTCPEAPPKQQCLVRILVRDGNGETTLPVAIPGPDRETAEASAREFYNKEAARFRPAPPRKAKPVSQSDAASEAVADENKAGTSAQPGTLADQAPDEDDDLIG